MRRAVSAKGRCEARDGTHDRRRQKTKTKNKTKTNEKGDCKRFIWPGGRRGWDGRDGLRLRVFQCGKHNYRGRGQADGGRVVEEEEE